MNLRIAAIHALSLHYPNIMGHTEDIQQYLVTGALDIVQTLPVLGLEGEELVTATSLLTSQGTELIESFLLSGPECPSTKAAPVPLWAVGIEPLPETFPVQAQSEWFLQVARAYIVHAIAQVFPDVMTNLADAQRAYVAGHEADLLAGLVDAGITGADAHRIEELLSVEAGVLPFELGLSGILNGTGTDSSPSDGDVEVASAFAVKILSADDKFDTPAFFTGHHTTTHAREAVEPYTISRRFVIDSVEAGIHYVIGDTDSGQGFWLIRVLPNGAIDAEFVISNVGNDSSVSWPAGTVQSGVECFIHARSEDIRFGRRMGSLRVNGVNGVPSVNSGNGRLGGLARPSREGNDRGSEVAYGITVLGAANMKARAADAQCDAIDSANTTAELLAAAQAVDPGAGEWNPKSDSNLAIGIVNTGSGGNASCAGMTNGENLVPAPPAVAAPPA